MYPSYYKNKLSLFVLRRHAFHSPLPLTSPMHVAYDKIHLLALLSQSPLSPYIPIAIEDINQNIMTAKLQVIFIGR